MIRAAFYLNKVRDQPMRWLPDLFWKAVAWTLVRFEPLAKRLIFRAFQTPFIHIMSADGQDMYMGRWWLFNGYDKAHRNAIPWFPISARIHHIKREDRERHLHDHPRNCRTIILKGWYREEREDGMFLRQSGYTGRIVFGQYHRITEVSPGGVWTIFITGRYRGGWGFKVDGAKVPSAMYLGLES